jgi:hypothetical protein
VRHHCRGTEGGELLCPLTQVIGAGITPQGVANTSARQGGKVAFSGGFPRRGRRESLHEGDLAKGVWGLLPIWCAG